MYYSTATESATLDSLYSYHDPKPRPDETKRDALDRAYQAAIDEARYQSEGSRHDWLVRLHDSPSQAAVVCRYRDGKLIPV